MRQSQLQAATAAVRQNGFPGVDAFEHCADDAPHLRRITDPWHPGSKPDAGAPIGVAGFAALAALAPPGVPCVAIGGITAAGVADHCAAIRTVLECGRTDDTYNIGGNAEMTNLEVVQRICTILDELRPPSLITHHSSLITFVKDWPGHDRRYAIDATKIRDELGWSPRESFGSALRKSVEWYLADPAWIDSVASGGYRDWVDLNYGER